jgi:hypothetical protein
MIGILLWLLGGIILAWFTWDLPLPSELGALTGLAYFALLFPIMGWVERYYQRRRDLD